MGFTRGPRGNTLGSDSYSFFELVPLFGLGFRRDQTENHNVVVFLELVSVFGLSLFGNENERRGGQRSLYCWDSYLNRQPWICLV